MHRKDHRQITLEALDSRQEATQSRGIVDVARAVQRQDREASRPKGEGFEDRRGQGALTESKQRVDHHVADIVDTLGAHAFPDQVVVRRRLGREAVVGDGVREDTVDLLRHRAVEASEAGLDVRQSETQLDRRDGGRQGRVDVAHDDDEIGALPRQDRDEAEHELCGLRRARIRDAEIDVWYRDLEVAEERARHVRVEVLTRVHEPILELRMLADLGEDRRDLDEVRARADDGADPHLGTTTRSYAFRTSRTGPKEKSSSSRASFPAVWRRLT